MISPEGMGCIIYIYICTHTHTHTFIYICYQGFVFVCLFVGFVKRTWLYKHANMETNPAAFYFFRLCLLGDREEMK